VTGPYDQVLGAGCIYTGAPGGLTQADKFLARWVPKIMASPACRDGGLIVITFDEGSRPGRLLR
jgi:phosphatidylinositol-3-phosphatase